MNIYFVDIILVLPVVPGKGRDLGDVGTVLALGRLTFGGEEKGVEGRDAGTEKRQDLRRVLLDRGDTKRAMDC